MGRQETVAACAPRSRIPTSQRYPKWVAKRLLLHALHGLAYLHRNGIAHGDLQPGNMLFSIEDMESIPEDELKQDEKNTAVPLKRLDGKPDKWAPPQLYLKQSLHNRVQLNPQLLVKLSDLGSGE